MATDGCRLISLISGLAASGAISGATYTAAGVELLLQHMLTVAMREDLEKMEKEYKSAPLPNTTLELLWRATRRCSASTPARVCAAPQMTSDGLRWTLMASDGL